MHELRRCINYILTFHYTRLHFDNCTNMMIRPLRKYYFNYIETHQHAEKNYFNILIETGQVLFIQYLYVATEIYYDMFHRNICHAFYLPRVSFRILNLEGTVCCVIHRVGSSLEDQKWLVQAAICRSLRPPTRLFIEST